jgi:PHD/YefM family antitoxin component YafN of YafNO toxin-antitoxin module
MDFKTVSVAEFRKNLQHFVNEELEGSALLLARHSDVVAVILEPKAYNEMMAKVAALEAQNEELKKRIAALENPSS